MAQGREIKYDARCPSCGTGVMSLASRCKICGAPLGRAAAPVTPEPAEPVDPIQRAHARRAERAAPEPTPRRTRLVLTLVGIVGVVGTVTAATWIAVSHAHSDGAAAGPEVAAATPPAPAPTPTRPDPLPPAPFAPPSSQQASPFPQMPSMPPPMPNMPKMPGMGSNPLGMPPGFTMPTIRDLMRQLGPGVSADPAAQKFADEALSLVCDKAASCGLFDASDRAACDMFASSLLSGALAGALSGQQCRFNPAKAQGCIQILRGIDCQAGGGGGQANMMQMLSVLQQAESCADTLACL